MKNNSKAFKEMKAALKEEALQDAKIEIFKELINRNDRLVNLGIAKKLDDSIMNDLKGDLSKAIQAARKAKLESIKLGQKAELAEIAGYSGCTHPDLLAESLMENINIDEDGQVYYCESGSKLPIRDKKTGKPIDTINLIKEMALNPNYAPLFGNTVAVTKDLYTKPVFDTTKMKNPWMKGDLNLTQQARILTENPELAELMQEAAIAKKW